MFFHFYWKVSFPKYSFRTPSSFNCFTDNIMVKHLSLEIPYTWFNLFSQPVYSFSGVISVHNCFTNRSGPETEPCGTPPVRDEGCCVTNSNGNCFFHLCVVNGSRVGPTQLETFLPNMTEFTLRMPERSTRYKFYLSALTQVGAGEVFAEELPHFSNEGEHFFSSLFTVSVELHINGKIIVNDLWVMVNL